MEVGDIPRTLGNDDDDWIASAQTADLPHMHAFTRGLAQDRDAVNAGVTMPYHNGGTEGVNTKTKRIMRQMHGRASFALPGATTAKHPTRPLADLPPILPGWGP